MGCVWQNGHSNGLGRAAAGQTPRGAGAGGRFRGVARASFPSHPPGWPRPPNPCTRACQPHPIAFWGPLQCHAADTIGVTAACWEGGGGAEGTARSNRPGSEMRCEKKLHRGGSVLHSSSEESGQDSAPDEPPVPGAVKPPPTGTAFSGAAPSRLPSSPLLSGA